MPEKEKDISVVVDITLEEIYNGSRKKVEYEKKFLGLDGRTEELKKSSVDIFVKSGMSETKKMTFDGKGHESAKHPTTDLHISFKLVQSAKGSNASLFQRVENNCLLYKHKLSLNDAIQCKPIKMTSLDGRILLIPVDQIQSPGSVKVIKGEGIASYDDSAVAGMDNQIGKGDLYIMFDIEFPTNLPTS